MAFFKDLWSYIQSYLGDFYVPTPGWTDVIDMLIIAVALYNLFVWIKTSRAKTLIKGIAIVVLFIVVAVVLKLHTILWIAKNLTNVLLIAIIVLFQPELRHAFDELGRRNFVSKFFSLDSRTLLENSLTDASITALTKTSMELSKHKTGALIVIEHVTPLGEYINTGIKIDAILSEQILGNIFEKNTPLHDGAVVIKNNRIVAATCYLPLTDSTSVNKELGTRHRAALGISEVSDSMTIIVSEETGDISIAYLGKLHRHLDESGIRKLLAQLQIAKKDEKKDASGVLATGVLTSISKVYKKGGRRKNDK